MHLGTVSIWRDRGDTRTCKSTPQLAEITYERPSKEHRTMSHLPWNIKAVLGTSRASVSSWIGQASHQPTCSCSADS